MPASLDPPTLVELGLISNHFEESVNLYRDVLGFPVVSESPSAVRFNVGPLELVLTRAETDRGRFDAGVRFVVDVERRDGDFDSALQSARRVAVAMTYDDGDRDYTDARGPDGEYVLISQPDRRSWAARRPADE